MKTSLTFFFFSLLMVLFIAQSCKCPMNCDGLCRAVDCGRNGTADDTENCKCVCNAGYEIGIDNKCNLEIREKFVGEWLGTDSCNATISANSMIKVEKISTNIQRIRIINLLHQNCDTLPIIITAIANQNHLSDFQTDCASLHSFSGNATYAAQDSSMTITYQFLDANNILQACQASFKKK